MNTFFTWTKQEKALSLDLDHCEDHYFVSGDQRWLNLSSISYQTHFGLKNKFILKAIKDQMKAFSMASPKHNFKLKEAVSEELIKRTPSQQYKVFYTLSGAEGIENALKMARQITGKKKILALKNSYHGATMGALSITGDWRNDPHLLPRQWTMRLPEHHGDPEAIKLQKYLTKLKNSKAINDIAAICLETITGGNGVFIPSQKWMKTISTFCRQNNILLILDEVVCAAHRTGPFFGFEHYPFLKPDFIVMAKGISGGYIPFGAVLVSKKCAKYYDKNVLACGLTNYAHPLGLAATKAILELTTQESFIKKKESNEETLLKWSQKLSLLGYTTRLKGSLMAVENIPFELKDLFQKGVYGAIQKGTLIMAPPLTLPKKHLVKGLLTIEELL